jgi:hypothetical protein
VLASVELLVWIYVDVSRRQTEATALAAERATDDDLAAMRREFDALSQSVGGSRRTPRTTSPSMT